MRWNLKQTQPDRVQALAEQISSLGFFQKSPAVSCILAKLLLLRGIDSPASAVPFLSPSLDYLHSPYLMTGMRAAIDRLDSAIERERARTGNTNVGRNKVDPDWGVELVIFSPEDVTVLI